MLNYEMTYRIKGETGLVRQAIVVNCKNIEDAMDSVARIHFMQVTGIDFYTGILLKHTTAYVIGVN